MEIKDLKNFRDLRGDLTPIEFNDLPFIPQRLFIVKNCQPGIKRGEHAHYKTRQYLICLKGCIKVVTHNGDVWADQTLREGQATLIEALNWDYQEFLTGNDILLVICSTSFDLDDYILDFEEFKHIVRSSDGNVESSTTSC